MKRTDFIKLASMFPVVCSGVIHLVAGCSGAAPGEQGGADPQEQVGTAESALTPEQCEYYSDNGTVRICHKTQSTSHPYTILKISEQACINAHAQHAHDYVAVGDPTCQGGGCLPQGGPCDATLPCCSGSLCVLGRCVTLCNPTTCEAQGKLCGTISDGCGGTLACDGCTEGGGTCGANNTCSCPLPSGYDPGCATDAWDAVAQECELSFSASGTACASGAACDGAGHCVTFPTTEGDINTGDWMNY